jgi:hypothetical protein
MYVCMYIYIYIYIYIYVCVCVCVCVCMDTNILYTHMLSSYTKKDDTMYADKALETVNRSANNWNILEKKSFIATYPKKEIKLMWQYNGILTRFSQLYRAFDTIKVFYLPTDAQ